MTGRRMGYCAGQDTPGAGRFRGPGFRHGQGHAWGWGRRMRGQGAGARSHELEDIHARLDSLKEEQAALEARLLELKKQSGSEE